MIARSLTALAWLVGVTMFVLGTATNMATLLQALALGAMTMLCVAAPHLVRMWGRWRPSSRPRE